MSKKRVGVVVFLALLLATIITLIAYNHRHRVVSNKLQITASFYPLAYFAERVGGDKVRVINITPAGAEPHDYEPTAQDIVNIEKSRLLILDGNGLEPWAESITKDLDSRNVDVVYAGEDVVYAGEKPTTRTITENGKTATDPHTWLDPVLAANMVDNITAHLITIDAPNALYYQSNAYELKKQLTEVDEDFKTRLADCKLDTFVTSHEAFGYLAARYNLKQVAIAGLTPEAEPSQKQLAEIAEVVKKNKIKYVFSENLLSPKLSNTLAQETGAQVLQLDAIEGVSQDPLAASSNYLIRLESNAQLLQVALECTGANYDITKTYHN